MKNPIDGICPGDWRPVHNGVETLASWKRAHQLDRNPDQFLQAIAQRGERMRQTVERMKKIQRQLATAPPPPPASSGH
jgi:transcriptional regulator of acetoin/glycerol metabolism